jgi:hypothetical protein
VTDQEAYKIQSDYGNATKSGAYLEWDLDTLLEVQKQLREARTVLRNCELIFSQGCEAAIEKVNQAIDSKRIEERAERHHKQAMHLVGRTLFWAIVGGIAAAVGTLVVLFHDTPLSKILPSTSSRSEPLLIPTPTVIASSTPEPSVTASETPQASLTPSEAGTPK